MLDSGQRTGWLESLTLWSVGDVGVQGEREGKFWRKKTGTCCWKGNTRLNEEAEDSQLK